MDIAVTKMSSKGQIVIPQEMRSKLKVGEKLLIIEKDNQFLLKKSSDIGSHFEEDFAFAEKTNKRLKSYEQGKGSFKTVSKEDFLRDLDSW
ncbi:MAG: AbrB/MazE/SpoVT family DNA-binding domain-containing protein [Candidatus Woesearchaeota archaeon]